METTGYTAPGMCGLSGFLPLCTRKPDLPVPGFGMKTGPLRRELGWGRQPETCDLLQVRTGSRMVRTVCAGGGVYFYGRVSVHV